MALAAPVVIGVAVHARAVAVGDAVIALLFRAPPTQIGTENSNLGRPGPIAGLRITLGRGGCECGCTCGGGCTAGPPMVLRDNDGHTSGDSPLPASELDFACDEVVTDVAGNLNRSLGRLVSFVGPRGTLGRKSIFLSPCTLGTNVPRLCSRLSGSGIDDSTGSAQLTLGRLVV